MLARRICLLSVRPVKSASAALDIVDVSVHISVTSDARYLFTEQLGLSPTWTRTQTSFRQSAAQ